LGQNQERKDEMALKKAPKVQSQDQIELKPFIGKAVAVKVTERRKVDTKFGERDVNVVTMLVEGNGEPMYGVLFQSYFSGLDIGEWYVGIVEREELRWLLNAEKVTKKQMDAFEKTIAAMEKENNDVPF
jgi:hypothetical protein